MASKYLKTNEEILANLNLYDEIDEPAPYDEDGKYLSFIMTRMCI
jgi:hypothetical protein